MITEQEIYELDQQRKTAESFMSYYAGVEETLSDAIQAILADAAAREAKKAEKAAIEAENTACQVTTPEEKQANTANTANPEDDDDAFMNEGAATIRELHKKAQARYTFWLKKLERIKYKARSKFWKARNDFAVRALNREEAIEVVNRALKLGELGKDRLDDSYPSYERLRAYFLRGGDIDDFVSQRMRE